MDLKRCRLSKCQLSFWTSLRKSFENACSSKQRWPMRKWLGELPYKHWSLCNILLILQIYNFSNNRCFFQRNLVLCNDVRHRGVFHKDFHHMLSTNCIDLCKSHNMHVPLHFHNHQCYKQNQTLNLNKYFDLKITQSEYY